MVLVIGWATAGFVVLLLLAALAVGLSGHVTRFHRAVRAAQADLEPAIRELNQVLPADHRHGR